MNCRFVATSPYFDNRNGTERRAWRVPVAPVHGVDGEFVLDLSCADLSRFIVIRGILREGNGRWYAVLEEACREGSMP